MNLDRLEKIKLALSTPKVQILLALFFVFITSSNWILSKALDSMHPTEFDNLFWLYASLELLLAVVVVGFCSRLGSLRSLKFGESIQSFIQKLFSRSFK